MRHTCLAPVMSSWFRCGRKTACVRSHRTSRWQYYLPLAGRIDVAGLDVTAVEKQVAAKLEKFLPDPNVSVVVKSIAGNLVYVQGKVIKPGPVQMAGPTAVLQALSMSGGLDKFADESEIKVVRGTGASQKILPVRYKDLVSGRDMSTNIQLQAGDTLVVP